MRNATVAISYDEEKLSATRIYMGQKDLTVEQELGKAMEGLYTKYVPANVREFLDLKSQAVKPSRKKVPAPGEEIEAAE